MSLLGQRLKQEREARGLALLQVEIDTRIRANVIQSLEEGDHDNLPPEPFLRGLIRSYSNYLRVDPQEMLDLYAADTIASVAPIPTRPTITKRPSAVRHPPAERPPQPAPPQAISMPPAEPAAPPATDKPAAPIPRSRPEPFKAIRRRLPLAPPSPKPTKPVLKTATGNPLPPIPPETLPPPELFGPMPARVVEPPPQEEATAVQPAQAGDGAASTGTASASTEEKTALHVSDLKLPLDLSLIPMPSIILMAVAIFFACLACGLFAYTRVGPAVSAIALGPRTSTPTRVPRTATPTGVPGASPTNIPTIAATAPPFQTVAAIPTQAPTLAPTARLTNEPGVVLNLDIVASQPVTVRVGIDGNLAFDSLMAAGSSQSWSARGTLYLRVQNFMGATVTFNGRKQVPLNFGERTLYERQWTAGPGGRVLLTTPVAPKALPAGPSATLPPPTRTPTATSTATSTPVPPSPTARPTASTTATESVTPSATVPLPTASPTESPTDTPTPTSSPTLIEPTPTLTPFS